MPPDEGRFLNRLPRPRPAPEFDEDTPPRPSIRRKADLSGDYTVDIEAWTTFRGSHVTFQFAAAGYMMLVVLLVVAGTLASYLWVIPLFARVIGGPAAELWVNLAAAALLYWPLLAGLPHVAVRAVLGERWGPADFLAPFTRYGHLLLFGLIVILAAAVTASPFFFVHLVLIHLGSDLPETMSAFLSTLPPIISPPLALYFLIRWQFALLLILDQGMPAPEALAVSERLTRGKVLRLVGFTLLLAPPLILGVMCCGVGLLIVSPPVLLFHTAAYLHATGQLAPLPAADAGGSFGMPPDEDDAGTPPGRRHIPPVE